ncbi:MAG: hypothetical protein R3C56_06625 [Pirellulaceae bacterium]
MTSVRASATIDIIRNTLWPNSAIASFHETVQVLTDDGAVHTGFIFETDETLTLGVASQDGKGREEIIPRISTSAKK